MSRLRVEAVALGATVVKEWRVMLRYWPNLLTLVIASILLPLGYWAQAVGFAGGDRAAMDAFAEHSGTRQVAGFLYLGWAVFLWISQMMWGPGTALRAERMQGSLEIIFLSPVSRVTTLFGPAIAQLLPAVLMFTVVGLALRFVFGVTLGPVQLAGGVVVVLASIPVLFAVGAIVAVTVLRFRDAEGIIAAVRGFIGILCGVTYPITVLPEWVRPVSRALPPTQVLGTLRAVVLSPVTPPDLWVRAGVLVAVGIILAAVAAVLLDLTVRSARRTGRLGQY